MANQQIGSKATREGAPSQGPLMGVKVIDLGTMFAGPFVASLLGDFGAEVLKVELPKVGDALRTLAPISKGVSGGFSILSRNKRSISLDIRKEKGKEILKKLVAKAHIVVENFRPGTLEQWGLGFDVLKKVNPKIVLVRISGFGQTGPYSHRAGFAPVAAAFSGFNFMQGEPDRPPATPPGGMVDYMAGVFGAMGAMMALHYVNEGNGEGQEVDVGLFEAPFRLFEMMIAEYDLLGKIRSRKGQMGQGTAPSGTYRCGDGKWVSMTAVTDNTFKRLTEAMGRTDLLTDPLFNTNKLRYENREALNAIVQEWFSQKTIEEISECLDKNGVPFGPINSAEDIFRNPHFWAREDLIKVPHPVLGEQTMPGLIPKFSVTPGSVRFPGPVSIGEHNLEIYQGELGISPKELEELKAEGIV